MWLTTYRCILIGNPPPSLLTGPRPPVILFLFPNMKLNLKGRRFDSIKEVQTVSQNVMKTLTRNDFQKYFRSWKSHWNRCINAKGNYMGGDGANRYFFKWLSYIRGITGNFGSTSYLGALLGLSEKFLR